MATRREHGGRTDLRKAAFKRKGDAWALLAAGKPHARGAGYLGGYAIECKLKAIAMEVFDCWTLAELAERWQVDDRAVYTHGLEALAKHLPLYHRFQNSPVWRDFAQQVNRWRVAWRYDPHDWLVERARAFLEAVDRVYHWLESNRGCEARMVRKAQQTRSLSKRRPREQLKRVLEQAFRACFPHDTVDISDGFEDNIHVMVVSRRFDEMSEQQKADLMWGVIDKAGLTKGEKALISLVYPVSPAEIK